MSKGKILFEDKGNKANGEKQLFEITGKLRTLYGDSPQIKMRTADVLYTDAEKAVLNECTRQLGQVIVQAVRRYSINEEKEKIQEFNMKKFQ